MQIIKPYGHSHVENDATGVAKRILRLRKEAGAATNPAKDIETFSQSHDELVLAQWISAIDKIARKPAGKNGPTDEQRGFRERLGNAAWALLFDKRLLPGLSNPDRAAYLAKLWNMKIAPYGTQEYRPRKHSTETPSAKGRWYERFAGACEVDKADTAAIAQKLHDHLYVAAYRMGAASPRHRRGRIAAQARSIADNVLIRPRKAAAWTWNDDDCRTYEAGNIAGEIRSAAEARENVKPPQRVTMPVAGEVLFAHYGRLFRRDDKVLSIHEARERFPRLFDLHMAVKDCYARLLKHHKKDPKDHRSKGRVHDGTPARSVSSLLPKTMAELFVLIGRQRANRDLNALVRLGKIIHYESAGGGEDKPADVVNAWPTEAAVKASQFWTSNGQARIKRNEAFVRVWRHVLTLASRTLTDWADSEGKIGNDILLGGPIRSAVGQHFDADAYKRKLDLLFGNRSNLFASVGDDTFSRRVLELSLRGIAQLRHTSFHFKGQGGFVDALREPASDPRVAHAITQLWQADVRERSEQLRKTLRGTHCEYFLYGPQNEKLLGALAQTDAGSLPLPRFGRMLQRVEDTWKEKDSLGLPKSANRRELENPARLCQYTTLKQLYERPFRTWLQSLTAATVNGYIDRAANRATTAAADLNAKGDEDRRELIKSKASRLDKLAEGEDIMAFFSDLSAETASEMRVQRGYDSDPENAREQAGYIEH